MKVVEVVTTIPLYWPGFRHKQDIAYRKELIFFTSGGVDEDSYIFYIRMRFTQDVWCLQRAIQYHTQPEKNDKPGRVRLVFVFWKLWSLSFPVTNKRPFPAPTRDKTFLSLCFCSWMKIKAPGPDLGLVICRGVGIYMALASYDTHQHLQVTVINQFVSTQHYILYIRCGHKPTDSSFEAMVFCIFKR